MHIFPFPSGDVFIETGTGNAETLVHALREPYREVYSIDVNMDLLAEAQRRLGADPRLHLRLGSSAEILPTILDPEKATVFWLDAHYSFGRHSLNQLSDRALADVFGECPLMGELAAIKAVNWRVPPVILIDDAICFTREIEQTWAAGINQAQWPTVQDIEAALPDGFVLHLEGQGRYFRAEAAA